jgi:hypothetical protein
MNDDKMIIDEMTMQPMAPFIACFYYRGQWQYRLITEHLSSSSLLHLSSFEFLSTVVLHSWSILLILLHARKHAQNQKNGS